MPKDTSFDIDDLKAKLAKLGSFDEIPLSTVLQACAAQGLGPTNMASWILCLSQVYQARNPAPSVTDYANAIYTVWSVPGSAWTSCITYAQTLQGLQGILAADGSTPYPAAIAVPAANINFLEISVVVDTDGLLTYYQQTQNTDATNYVALTDNHPAGGQGEGGAELYSDSVISNMTILWTATAKKGASPAITLVSFNSSQMGVFNQVAPAPGQMPGAPNQFVTRAVSGSIPQSLHAQYAYNFQVAGSPVTFGFDPFIGV